MDPIRNLSRRCFIKGSLAGTVLLAGPGLRLNHADTVPAAKRFLGTDMVQLGKTGIRVSRLAQGTGFNGWARSSEHTRMGKPAFERLLHHGLDHGVKFIDMADLYGTHPYVKDVIKGVSRDRYVLLTKIWTRKEDWVSPSGGAIDEVDRFRKELAVEMIDVCLIHCMTNSNWTATEARVRDELSQLKQKGVIRAVGVSCHDFGALQTAATHPWVDVIFARINYKGGQEYSMDASAAEVADVLKQARKNGKAVVGMKIYGAGKLVKPEEKDLSLTYVFGNELVDAITIGMTTTEHVDDTLQRMSQVKV